MAQPDKQVSEAQLDRQGHRDMPWPVHAANRDRRATPARKAQQVRLVQPVPSSAVAPVRKARRETPASKVHPVRQAFEAVAHLVLPAQSGHRVPPVLKGQRDRLVFVAPRWKAQAAPPAMPAPPGHAAKPATRVGRAAPPLALQGPWARPERVVRKARRAGLAHKAELVS